MGDWLDTGAAFGGNVRTVLGGYPSARIRAGDLGRAVRRRGGIGISSSSIPDWFIKDADGAPLRSDRVTFGGWRRGPWYALDGTHPEVQSHLERVFRTMRNEWGCTYFKLDANFWGAMHGGRFHDARATRVEAYRRGMEAVLRGAGDSFILGCNHPIWPSLGLIHGSRSSNDIKRTWDRIKTTGMSEPAAQLAERASVVERSGCDCAGERPDRRRVSISRVGHLRERRDGAVRRRSDEAAARPRGHAQETRCRRPASRPRSMTPRSGLEP